MEKSAQSSHPRFSTWKVKPRYGEPAHAYMAQLVREEGHVSARVYANEIEISGRNIVMAEILNEVLKLPLSDEHRFSLKHWTPIWTGKFHSLAGQTLRRRQISFYHRRFCRACLAEDLFHRAWWDIPQFRVCPIHRTPIECRTLAGDPIKWWRPSFETAADGEYIPRRADRNEQEGFESYVLTRLGVMSSPPRPLLDGAGLHEVIDVCEGIGRLVLNPGSMRRPRRTSLDVRAGFDFLSLTREGFEDAVVRWLEDNVPEARRNSGLTNGYGWFAQATLHNFGRASMWPEIHDALLRAFARTGRIGRQYTGGADLPHRELTIKEAAKKIGGDVRGLRAISRHIGLARFNPVAADRAYLTGDKVEILQAAVKDLIPITEVAVLLGCTQLCARGLVKAGAMRGLTGTRLFGQEGRGLAVLKADVDALRQRIISVPVGRIRGHTHKLPYLARMKKKPVADLVMDVLDGRLAVTRADRRSPGIAAWRFDATFGKNPYRRQVDEDMIRSVEASVISGFHMDALASIAEAGIIKSEKRGGRIFFNRQSFNQFHARYANAKLYRDQIGCTDYMLEDRLRQLGIDRYFPEVKGRYNIHIVDRVSLERALGSVSAVGPDPEIWTDFREEMTRVCPSWTLPQTTGGKSVKAYLATRSTFVEMEVVKNSIVIRKTFRKSAPREWNVFVDKQDRIRSEWSAFKWSHSTGWDGVTATFVVSSTEDVELVAVALRDFYGHYRNPRKMLGG